MADVLPVRRDAKPVAPYEDPSPGMVFLADDNLLDGLTNLRWRLDSLLATHAPLLRVDASRLSRMSSATLAALLFAQRRCRARGGRVVLDGLNRRCRDMLTRTGVASLFAPPDNAADSLPRSRPRPVPFTGRRRPTAGVSTGTRLVRGDR